MNKLNKTEKMIIKKFILTPIPQYVFNYCDESFDLLDCYEIAFTYANAILRRGKIKQEHSPWGDGNSVIFDERYSQLLIEIRNSNLSDEINEYCQLFLSIIKIFQVHF